jgi:hypothetical protein
MWEPATWEPEREREPWTASPDFLVLTAPVEGENIIASDPRTHHILPDGHPETKRIQLINYSSQNLDFDLSWPGHFILVTPERGVLKAK